MGYTGDKKREYQLEWMRKRRNDFLEGKSCVKCGSTESLEVDHIDPSTKKWNPAKIWSRRKEDREAELVSRRNCFLGRSLHSKSYGIHRRNRFD